MDKLKISYITTNDSSDIHSWSGLDHNILKGLQNVGFETECIDKLKPRNLSRRIARLKRSYHSRIWSKSFLRDREPLILKDYSNQIEKRLESIDHDIIFSPGTNPIAHLKTDKPIVFWTDATFAGMIDFYEEFTNLCQATIKHGHESEQLALSKCALALYSSQWAADSAIKNYDVDPAKVQVVPFGANISCNRSSEDIIGIADAKDLDSCKLLFLGVDWKRKGGDKALQVATLLNKNGIETELHVVGCSPPPDSPSFVMSHGFISKKTEKGIQELEKLFTESHFLVLPSEAECFGIVFAEASSFGLPSLATNSGGIPSAITNGKNGQTFELDEAPEAYVAFIERHMSSKDNYRKIALSSFDEYSERLNWNSTSKRACDLITQYCQ